MKKTTHGTGTLYPEDNRVDITPMGAKVKRSKRKPRHNKKKRKKRG